MPTCMSYDDTTRSCFLLSGMPRFRWNERVCFRPRSPSTLVVACYPFHLVFLPRFGWLVVLIRGGMGEFPPTVVVVVVVAFRVSKFEGWNRSVWRTRWNNEPGVCGWMWRFYRGRVNASPFCYVTLFVIYSYLTYPNASDVNARVMRIFHPVDRMDSNVMDFLSRNVKEFSDSQLSICIYIYIYIQ